MSLTACPVCGSDDFVLFHRRDAVPVLCNGLCRSAEEARAVPRGDVRLVVCARCSMIWNLDFDPAALTYGAEYENSLHFSPEFQSFAADQAAWLASGIAPDGVVVELGCGQGDFLELVCERPDLSGIGVDPGYRGPVDPSARVSCAPGSWEAIGEEVRADLVCARHVLEHLSSPADLFAAAAHLLRPAGRAYVEVPHAGYMLDEVALWDVIYEHPLYFVDESLGHLAERTGFEVVMSGSGFGGQYLWALCRPGAQPHPLASSHDVVERSRAFDRRAVEVVARYEHALDEAERAGQRVALWGTGSKGTTFLNTVAGASTITMVVDANPRKAGLHVPGTGQPVVAPQQLKGADVDLVIVLNPNYRAEITAALRDLDVSAEVLAAR